MLPVEEIKGVDLHPSRRPGYQRNQEVAPWPHTRYPPVRQPGEPASLTHGRPGKETTPVFGTATPPKGLSGAIRQVANDFPDHQARHWLLLLAADRVEATIPRLRRLATFGLPAVIAGALATTKVRGERTARRRAHLAEEERIAGQPSFRAPPPTYRRPTAPEVSPQGWTWT